MTDDELFAIAYERSDADTRYILGVADFYVFMACTLTGKSEKTFLAKAKTFVNKTSDWHECHRWNFQPHPDWRKEIIG